ncbi:hypothetical protein YC2023_093558 [Brassica napus]|uniref:Uncharacterized protein n=1 Tax=Brassica campestris TaxID=3711 RepID=A0A3P6BC23_BRACM|nr:unnamed protein product [Brassica rapa]
MLEIHWIFTKQHIYEQNKHPQKKIRRPYLCYKHTSSLFLASLVSIFSTF